MKELVWISFEGTLWRRCSCSVVGKKLCGIIVDGSCNASPFHSIFVLAVPFKTPKQTKPHKKTWLKIFSLLCFADYEEKNSLLYWQEQTSGVLMQWRGEDQWYLNLTWSAQTHKLDRSPCADSGNSSFTALAAASSNLACSSPYLLVNILIINRNMKTINKSRT